MKTAKVLAFILLIAFGIFIVVFGEHDDSPGAQGLGLILVFTSLWFSYKLLKKKPR